MSRRGEREIGTPVGISPLLAQARSGHTSDVDKHFIVDWTLPPSPLVDLHAAHRAIDEAGRRLTAEGEQVRCVHSTYAPSQHRWLCVFAAESEGAVRKAHEIAQLPVPRIVEAIDLSLGDRQPT